MSVIKFKDNRETESSLHHSVIVIQHTQPFYSSMDLIQDNPDELVPEGTFRHLLDFLVQNEDNTADTPTIQMD